MKRKGLLPIVFLALGLLPTAGICDQKADEIQGILSSSTEFKPSSLILIHFLGGMLPIPNRFHLNADSDAPLDDFEFVSPTYLSLKEFVSSEHQLLGEIVAGYVDKMPAGRLPTDAPIKKFDCYGLSIEIRDTKIQGVHYVLFLKDHKYVSVMDSDDDLWKAMLIIYGKSIKQYDVCPEIADVAVRSSP